jgi:hypothetical protein
VSEWKSVITRAELLDWIAFYERHPFDDYNRFLRPAALVSTALGGGNVRERLEWLQPTPGDDMLTDADMNTLRAFGLRKD